MRSGEFSQSLNGESGVFLMDLLQVLIPKLSKHVKARKVPGISRGIGTFPMEKRAVFYSGRHPGFWSDVFSDFKV
jgi:hypothetical protein